MEAIKPKPTLLGQRISGIAILMVGIIHTAFHFIIPQPRQALLGIARSGFFNTLGTDWATATFSTLMSLTIGFLFIVIGLFIFEVAKIPWKVPLSVAIALTVVFLYIVIGGPNGGGWLGLPFCAFLIFQAVKPEKFK